MGYPISGGTFFTFNYHVSTGEWGCFTFLCSMEENYCDHKYRREGKTKGVSFADSTWINAGEKSGANRAARNLYVIILPLEDIPLNKEVIEKQSCCLTQQYIFAQSYHTIKESQARVNCTRRFHAQQRQQRCEQMYREASQSYHSERERMLAPWYAYHLIGTPPKNWQAKNTQFEL